MNDIGIVTDDVVVSGFAFEVDGFKYMLLFSFSLLLLVFSNVKDDEDGPSDGESGTVAMEVKFRERRVDRKLDCFMGFKALFKSELAIDFSGFF